MRLSKYIIPNLDELDYPFHREQALEALEKRDGDMFGSCAGNNSKNLGLVFDNIWLLKELGIYEAALFTAYNYCKFNFHDWSPVALSFLFRKADRDRLRSLGSSIPCDPIVAYRGVAGVGRKRRIRGLSWTTSLDIACWFALWLELENPAVFRCVFKPADIYVIHNEREENEVIGLPRNPVKCKLTLAQMQEAARKYNKPVEADFKKFKNLKTGLKMLSFPV